MQIRELTIERFRGISFLVWRPTANVVCLVGPGDSTKTTILDAIDLALGSRWAISVSDADFHYGKTENPLTIKVTVGQLPAALLDEDKYGLDIQGWHPAEGVHDEPEPGDEAVLTILFSVDDSLEPSWRIVNDRRPEGRNFPSKDRELLGLIRLGGDIDRHLSWARGSALTRNTDDIKEVNRVIASAQREARDAVAAAPLEKLKAAATKAQMAATRLGVRITSPYPWPGNVRELQNAIEHACVLASRSEIDVDDLPACVREPIAESKRDERLIRPLREIEREHILAAMAQTGGNRRLAAAVLGIGIATLQRKLRRYQREGQMASISK